jgi:hypothetical protein
VWLRTNQVGMNHARSCQSFLALPLLPYTQLFMSSFLPYPPTRACGSAQAR